MKAGYDKPLYLLPFDHRQSYVTGMFNFKLPLSAAQYDEVRDTKQLIYEGFRQAVADGVLSDRAGILVDEEFGKDVLRDAHRHGTVIAVSTEQSGIKEFDFEYGVDFAHHIENFDPTFAKALVRYNPEGDPALNIRQVGRLRLLSDYCKRTQRRFMFELLVPPTDQQLALAGGSQVGYDQLKRPVLMDQAIHSLQDAGVEPDIWKIEGLDRLEDCVRIVDSVRRDGRTGIGCIVLGRGADEAAVRNWLATAASVDGYIGFAVGRTSFWDAVAGYRAKRLARVDAIAQITQRFLGWVTIFEAPRMERAANSMAITGPTHG
jgi:myo-inositol catabolism protein IolC